MGPQNQKLMDYVSSHHPQGTDPALLMQQLIQAGWDASQVDRVIAQMPQTQPMPQATGKVKKPEPPVAAQILYALGFLGLIAGIFVVVMMFIGSSTSAFSDVAGIFGLSSLNIKMAAIIFGLIVIGLFTLIDFIRAKKKWALISYSTVVALGFVATLFDYLTRSIMLY